MRIACLQFAPQVGDVDNNLNRADAVLARANQADVDTLDLLVLPELAFSGHKFDSYDAIAPYLEPAGSGISSLWARTTALTHNTNVLVGYPEKKDASGTNRISPEHFNSAILVNAEGETVANYRKTFLHSSDETWAVEGKDFFGQHVPGLGITALGISSDVDPYKLEAPWHAFEFAFHILDVRANLAIVTMSWTTTEDCEHFTQFPDEPDMETLTYWAQRLEPVIRDESRDELVIVFCNRSGIEDTNTVYAGTSAVIGIYQGEVKVYGLLGRGVKELLIVDTDLPPFANLTVRKQRAHLSPFQYELKASGQYHGTDGLLLEPTPVSSGLRSMKKVPANQANLTNGSISEEREPSSSPVHNPSTPETVVALSPEFPTPNSSAAKSLAARETCPALDELDDTVSTTSSSSSDGQIFGGSVEISFEDDADDQNGAEPDPEEPHAEELVPTRAFASPPPPPSHPFPQDTQLPKFPHKPTIFMQYPSSKVASIIETDEHTAPASDQFTEPVRGRRTQKAFIVGARVPTRPSTATGVRPSRPSSPKSRNLSRTGRFHPDSSEVGVTDASDAINGLLNRRTQSVSAQRREFHTASPNLRSMSRPGVRVAGLDQGLIERALDFYLGSEAVDARDIDFVARSHSRRRESHEIIERSARPESTAPSSLSDHTSSPGRDSPFAKSGISRSATCSPESNTGSDSSRTVLWKEDSQIVGQQVRRSDSSDGTRGRKRSRSAASTNARQASARSPHTNGMLQTRSPSRPRVASEQRPTGSAARRISVSRFQQRNGDTIRTIRDPSLGHPVHPDDEIIAEITLRRPSEGYGSSSCGTEGTSVSKTQPARKKDDERPYDEECDVPSSPGPSVSPTEDSEKTPTINKYWAASQGPARLALQTSIDELDDLRAPNLSRGSFRTLSSYEPSPITPPPRRFDPRTPKAMVFDESDFNTSPRVLKDQSPTLRFEGVDARLDEMLSKRGATSPVS